MPNKRYLVLYYNGDDHDALYVYRDPDWDPQATSIKPEDFGLPDDVDVMFLFEAGDDGSERPIIYRIDTDAATEMMVETETETPTPPTEATS